MWQFTECRSTRAKEHLALAEKANVLYLPVYQKRANPNTVNY
jgi:hypothetical protein